MKENRWGNIRDAFPGYEIIDVCLFLIEDIPTAITHPYIIAFDFQKQQMGHSFLIREIGFFPTDLESISLTRLNRFVTSAKVELVLDNKTYLDVPGGFIISAWPGLTHTLIKPILVSENFPIVIKLLCLPCIFQYSKPRKISFRCDIWGELIRRII